MAFARRRAPYARRPRKPSYRKRTTGRKRKRTTVRRRTTRKGSYRGRGKNEEEKHWTRGVGHTVRVPVIKNPPYKRIQIPIDYSVDDIVSKVHDIGAPVVQLAFERKWGPRAGALAGAGVHAAAAVGSELYRQKEGLTNWVGQFFSGGDYYQKGAHGYGSWNARKVKNIDLIHSIMRGAQSAHSLQGRNTMQSNSNVPIPGSDWKLAPVNTTTREPSVPTNLVPVDTTTRGPSVPTYPDIPNWGTWDNPQPPNATPIEPPPYDIGTTNDYDSWPENQRPGLHDYDYDPWAKWWNDLFGPEL